MKCKLIERVMTSVLALVSVCVSSAAVADQAIPAPSKDAIRIDVPVTLEKGDVVFVMDHLAFAGDMPLGIRYMHLLAKRYHERHVPGQIIGLFFGDAAYLTLNDRAYNAYRSVSTGNPYKEHMAALISQGVVIEECAVSMKHHAWSNEDLLPGVKVTTGAVIRLIQLAQQEYVQVQP